MDPWSWSAPLLLVVIFSTLLVLAAHAGALGIPAALIVGSWFLKYAFVLLEHLAHGRPGLPVLSAEDANPFGERRPVVYATLLAAGWAVTGAAGAVLGAGAATGLRIGALLLLPAVIAGHVVCGRLAEALRPRAIAGTLRALGPAYVGIVGAAIACGWAARGIALDAAHHSLWLGIAVLMTLWLALFAVLGLAIHRRRFELGFDPEHSPERRDAREARDLERERSAFMDRLFTETRAGPTGNAWASIEARLAGQGARADELAWILERLTAWPDPRLAHRVAQELVPLLLEARRTGAALDVVRARMRADPAFRPARATDTLRIAELARAAGDRATSRALLADIASRFPDDPAAAAAAGLAGAGSPSRAYSGPGNDRADR